MKKLFLIIIVFIFVLLCAVVLLRLLSGEDNWICQNGEWIKHGQPSGPPPSKSCGSVKPPTGQADKVKLDNLRANDLIYSTLEITGQAIGPWYFEASFPIRLFDASGQIIASTIAQAQSDWMTTNFVPFRAKLEFVSPKESIGTLVFVKDNPSGLPKNNDEVRIPVRLPKQETTTVKVYFNNDKLDPEISCNKVFPVERIIVKTSAVAWAALEELLKGPTERERTGGYFSNINSGVKIQKLTIENGVARVDFNEQLEFQMGGSCRVAAIRSEITETLKQFLSVKEIIISVNGRTEDILQP
jgi:hypothetical protein